MVLNDDHVLVIIWNVVYVVNDDVQPVFINQHILNLNGKYSDVLVFCFSSNDQKIKVSIKVVNTHLNDLVISYVRTNNVVVINNKCDKNVEQKVVNT